MNTSKLFSTTIISILFLTINSNSQTLENSSSGAIISDVESKLEYIAYGDVQNCDNNFSVQNQENLLLGSIPKGAPHPINRIFYEKPFGINTFVHPWFQAATCTESANNGYVEIEYVKVIQEDNYGNTSFIQTIEYGGFGPLSDAEGKLYLRAFDNDNLFFYENTWTPMSNSNQSNGLLRIDVGEFPNYISHWWTERFSGSIDYRYYVEIRMKISGSIGVQMGCDYYQNMDNLDGVKEAWVSDWYGDTNGEFITITIPNYTSPGFDCKDYGFTEDGVFYFSEQFINYSGAESLRLGGSFNKWGPLVELSYQDGYYVYNHGESLSSSQTYYLKGFYNCNNIYYLPVLANIEKSGDITDVNIGKIDLEVLTAESGEFFRLYPNPTLGRFTIEFHDFSEDERTYVEVYGMRGERILREEISSELVQHVFNIEDQMPGVYIVRVVRGHKYGVRRLIKT